MNNTSLTTPVIKRRRIRNYKQFTVPVMPKIVKHEGIEYKVTDNHPVIGDLAIHQSGIVVKVESLRHIEILVQVNAKVLKPTKPNYWVVPGLTH